MAPKKSIQDLPVDLIRTLADVCPTPALVNLRSTCRKLETETFATFTHRVFGRLTLTVSVRSVDRLTRVLEDSPQLASAVDDLSLKFVPCCGGTCPGFRAQLSNPGPVKDIPDGKIGQLLAKLPKLTTLHLQGVTSSVLQKQLQPKKLRKAMRKGDAGPYTLNLRYILLPSSELKALLNAFGDLVNELHISYVASTDGKWHSIFEAMKLLGLEKLEFNELRGAVPRMRSEDPGDTLQVLEDDRRINKGVRGAEGGIESFWVRTKSACMMGEKAVEAGLKVVCGYLGTNERSS